MPYAAYGESQVDLCLPKNATGRGDALARQQVRMHDIMVSFELLFEALGHMYQTQETQVTCHNDSQSLGIGWSESPRGANYYCVSLLPGGLVDHVKITSASFTNMWGFRQTVSGISAMMDFIINEASFGLSIAGCDR